MNHTLNASSVPNSFGTGQIAGWLAFSLGVSPLFLSVKFRTWGSSRLQGLVICKNFHTSRNPVQVKATVDMADS
ncbi:MAG: hypothetical protein R3C53_26775 [Pirellulaceae bacterium]